MPGQSTGVRGPRAPVSFLEAGQGQAASLFEIRERADALLPSVDWIWPGLVRILQGTKQLGAGGKTLTATAGSLLWMPGALRVDVRNIPEDGAYRADALAISPGFLARLPSPPGARPEPFARRLPAPEGPLLEAWERAVEGLRQGLPQAPMTHRLLELLAWVQAAGIRTLPAQPSLRVRLLERLSSEPGHGWRLGDLAADAAMSEDTLQRRLADEGTSFRELLHEARLSRALLLLQTTDQAVGWISEEVGFASPSRFSARFRERYGLRPSEVR